MPGLTAIQEQLLDTSAALARIERDIAQNPADRALSWGAKSLAKRQQRLEHELREAASVLGREVCRYRLIPEQNKMRIGNIAGTLGGYQSLVTVFFAALKEGAKATASVSPSASEDTAMEFCYASAGSAVFVFSSRNDTDIFGSSFFNDAIGGIAEVMAAKDPKDILKHARRLGPAPIRVLYRWADEHVKGALSADIEWVRGAEVRSRLLVQVPEFVRLRQAIMETSNEETAEVELTGELKGADVILKTFHFVSDGGVDIRGKLGGGVDDSQTYQLPMRYKVTVRQTVQVRYSTEQTSTSYELLTLETA